MYHPHVLRASPQDLHRQLHDFVFGPLCGGMREGGQFLGGLAHLWSRARCPKQEVRSNECTAPAHHLCENVFFVQAYVVRVGWVVRGGRVQRTARRGAVLPNTVHGGVQGVPTGRQEVLFLLLAVRLVRAAVFGLPVVFAQNAMRRHETGQVGVLQQQMHEPVRRALGMQGRSPTKAHFTVHAQAFVRAKERTGGYGWDQGKVGRHGKRRGLGWVGLGRVGVGGQTGTSLH
jgi:hypothetical protein